MRLGREATAARRQASRLAGLVRLPAAWPIQTAIRRQASWLAIKASMASKPRWPFAFQIVQTMNAGEQPLHSLTLQNRQATGVIPTRKGSVCPPPTAGEQSGDRQRREKGPPILTAEKGEHERAPPVCESWPTPLRATLRAPPSKWAVKGFFPAGERSEPRSRTAPKGLPQDEARDAQRGGPPLESPCRWLSFAHFSFATERKV